MEAYFKRIEEVPKEKILWNIPEQKQGSLTIIGGNSQMFRTSVKTAEFVAANYPVKELRLVLPDALEKKLPPLDNVTFLHSTDSGSFGSEEELARVLGAADFNLLIGDFSKNSVTGKAVAGAVKSSEKPLIATRDTVDLLAENQSEEWLMNENVTLLASITQLQKVFRSIYYPKMLLLTQSLVQVSEALHKFTLSYPVGIITLHDGQILVSRNGQVSVLPLEKSFYSPIMLWMGEAAAKVAVLNMYNPGDFSDASLTALSR